MWHPPAGTDPRPLVKAMQSTLGKIVHCMVWGDPHEMETYVSTLESQVRTLRQVVLPSE